MKSSLPEWCKNLGEKAKKIINSSISVQTRCSKPLVVVGHSSTHTCHWGLPLLRGPEPGPGLALSCPQLGNGGCPLPAGIGGRRWPRGAPTAQIEPALGAMERLSDVIPYPKPKTLTHSLSQLPCLPGRLITSQHSISTSTQKFHNPTLLPPSFF